MSYRVTLELGEGYDDPEFAVEDSLRELREAFVSGYDKFTVHVTDDAGNITERLIDLRG